MSGGRGISGLVSVQLGDACFGVPVLQVQDVVADTPLNLVPLAPPEVAGVMNLRGRIVTAIDMRRRFGLERRDGPQMSVIVEHRGELYALVVDDVGDVLWLGDDQRESLPVTLCPHWQSLCRGLHRLQSDLLLVLDIEAVLSLTPSQARAA